MIRSITRLQRLDPRNPPDPTEIMVRAERSSRERGLLFTPMRRRILQELALAGGPLTAYDLVARLSVEKRVAPVQVYRTLEFLREAGLIHRLATRGAFVIRDVEDAPDSAVVFLLCRLCGGVTKATSSAVADGLNAAATADGFEPLGLTIEVEGQCAECRNSG